MHDAATERTIGLESNPETPHGLLKRSMEITGLSKEHLQRRFFRLCIIAGSGAALYGAIDVVSAAWSGPPRLEDPILMGMCALISFAMALITRKSGLRRSTMMELAFTYQVLFCTFISLAEALNSRQTGDSIWGVSWVCVAMVAFPAILPCRPFPMLMAATMSALSGPAMYLVAHLFQAKEMDIGEALNMYIPNIITLGIASSTILYVASWTKNLEKAKQMGSYRLVARIGLGAMGEVWKAEHATLARPAAIKLIHAKQPLSGAQLAQVESRFYREAQATASLASSHTVTVFDYGTTRAGDQYYVMELLDGITLQDAVTRHGPMRPERVIHLLAQICHSLVEAHDAKLIHRDIKPANIFICHKGAEYDFVKVLDFGLVKPELDSANMLTLGAEILGTPAFIAPEAAKGQTYDKRSDIYSLGCVAYFLLSGKLVFDAESPVEMILKHASETPRPIAECAPEPQNKDLNELIMRCLAKDRDLRPQSCLEIIAELEKIALECPWSRGAGLSWWRENIYEKQ